MSEPNTNFIVLNIVSFAKPYATEIRKVPEEDLSFVLRRLLWQIPSHIPAGCSRKVLMRYRLLEKRVEHDLATLIPKRRSLRKVAA